MIVYTVQTLDAYYKMREQGYLSGEERFVWEEFKDPYKWMMSQMEKRIPGYTSGTYPIWVWRRRVNRNESALLPKGTKGVILTLEIPDDQLLWSDFETWHSVLSSYPVTDSEDEWEEFLKDEENFPVEDTWERIFDFELLRSIDDYWGKLDEEWIQGVTPRITMDMVKKVTRFIAKGTKL